MERGQGLGSPRSFRFHHSRWSANREFVVSIEIMIVPPFSYYIIIDIYSILLYLRGITVWLIADFLFSQFFRIKLSSRSGHHFCVTLSTRAMFRKLVCLRDRSPFLQERDHGAHPDAWIGSHSAVLVRESRFGCI
jgi:hypothetical protein